MSTLSFTPILHPPLGTTTVVSHDEQRPIRFYALMELALIASDQELDEPEDLDADSNGGIDEKERFTVLLFWSVNGRGTWKPAPFREVADEAERDRAGVALFDLTRKGDEGREVRRDLFVLDLEYSGNEPLQFCLKYSFSDGPWLWAGARIGGLDGRVIFQNRSISLSSLLFQNLFSNLDEQWKIQCISSPEDELSTGTNLWDVRAPVDGECVLNFGRPVNMERWMALVKIAAPWMGPLHAPPPFATTKPVLFLLYQRTDGTHVVVLPVSGVYPTGATSYLNSDSDSEGRILVERRGDDEPGSEAQKIAQVIVTVDWDVHKAIDEAFRYLRGLVVAGAGIRDATALRKEQVDHEKVKERVVVKLKEWREEAWKEEYRSCEFNFRQETIVGEDILQLLAENAFAIAERTKTIGELVNGALPLESKHAQVVEEKIRKLITEIGSGCNTEENVNCMDAREYWDEGLAYYTWNGMGWDLSEERILNALSEIEKKGIRVCNLIVDDNWQSLAGRNYGSSGTWSRFEANEKFPEGLKGFVKKVKKRFPYIRHIGVWHALHGYWDGITPDGELAKTYKTVQVDWWDNVNSVNRPLTLIAPEDVERFYDDFHRFLKESGIDGVKTDVQCRIDELTHSEDKGRLQRAYQDAFARSSMKYFDRRVVYCMAHVPQILYYALLPDDGPRVFFRTSDDFYPNVPQSHTWHVFANSMNMMLYSRLHILPDWDMFQTALPHYAPLHAAARCLSGGPIFITDTPGDHNLPLISSMTSLSPLNYARSLRPSGMALPVEPYSGYKSNRLLKISNVAEDIGAILLGIFNVSDVALTEMVALKGIRGMGNGKYVITGSRSGRVLKMGGVRDEFVIVSLEPTEWEIFTIVPLIEEGRTEFAALGLGGSITGIAAVEGITSEFLSGKVVVKVMVKAMGLLAVWASDLPKRSIDKIKVSIAGRDLPRWYFDKSSKNEEVLEISLLKAWEKLKLGGMGDEGNLEVVIKFEGL